MAERHTLVHQLRDWAARFPDKGALFAMNAGGFWDMTTWGEYARLVDLTARGLLALGHQVGDAVALLGGNRPEWVICQMGIMSAAGIPGPIYTTLTVEQTAYIASHCKAKIAICDTNLQLAKYRAAIAEGLLDVEWLICMDAVDEPAENTLSLTDLWARGEAVESAKVDARVDGLQVRDTALLIYTSGTTGQPKGAMLCHEGMCMIGAAVEKDYPELLALRDAAGEEMRVLSYLPLCHVAEQMFTNFLTLAAGGEIYFCPDLKKVKDYLLAARPTVFLAVPRVWEKFEAVLRGKFAEATGVKAKLLGWARKTEFAAFQDGVATGEPKISFSRKMANAVVLKKLLGALGLDKLAIAVSGAAPISTSTLEFFASIGICIHEGFGMTETSGACTANPYLVPRFGTVGRPLTGVEVRIAEDGEIMLRGPNMTLGYLYMPEKTAELYAEDGWMHTGDLGSVDADGFLRITGRKKDIIITAGGKNIAPAEMEGHIKAIPGVGQAVVVGDRQPYLCALVVLDTEALPELAKASGATLGPLAQMAVDPKVCAYIQQQVESGCNAAVARYQTVKKTKVLPLEFTLESGEMTPTMKIKRNVVNERFAGEIASFYED